MRRLAAEAGETLVVTLATVAVLGIAITAVLLGVGTALRVSGSAGRGSETVVVLTRAAEAVKQAPTSCWTLSPEAVRDVLDLVQDLPAGWAPSDVTVDEAACFTAADGAVLPRVVLRATPPDGSAPRTLLVVPRVVA